MSITKEVFEMKNNIKSFICGMLVMGVISSAAVIAADNWQSINVLPNTIKVVVDGKEVQADNFLYNDTTYLPIRAVSEALKMDVQYDNATSTATISEKREDDNMAVTSKYIPSEDIKKKYLFELEEGIWYADINYVYDYIFEHGYTMVWDADNEIMTILKDDEVLYNTGVKKLIDGIHMLPYDKFVDEIESLLK